MQKKFRISLLVALGLLAALAITSTFVRGENKDNSSLMQTNNEPKKVAVGYVDYQTVFDQHPDTKNATEMWQAEFEKREKDFAQKSKTLGKDQLQQLEQKYQEELQGQKNELIGAIKARIDDAVSAVAKRNGVTVVLAKETVLFGGIDLTDEVLKEVGAKK